MRADVPFGFAAISKVANEPGYGDFYVFHYAEAITKCLENQ
jgi:hypothetical protein